MSQAGSSSIPPQAPPSVQPANSDGLVSLDGLLVQITTTDDPFVLNHLLKNFAPKDVRDTILASTLSDGGDPLTVLDMERNTIAVLYIISARLSSTAAPITPSLEIIEEFCSRFDPVQARIAPDRVTSLARGIIRIAEASENPKYALGPVANLVTRYPPTLSHLTNLHPIFLKLCVSTGHYSAALPLLETPITTVDTTLSELHYNDNLVYHYAGGVAFGALKRWAEAEEFFEICASSPAQVPAAIQLEASKKLVLVQLILYGKTVPPPKYINTTLQRLLKSSPYGVFIKTYPKRRSELLASITKDVDIFTNERNMGLIHQAIDRAPRWLIKKLTSTYLTLDLSDIGREVGIESEEEVRATIVNMIESDEINATISADGTVTFSDAVPQFSKADVDLMLRKAQEQGAVLLELERQMNASKEYLTKAVKHKDEAGWGPEEEMFSMGGGGSGWVEESPYS